MIRRRKLKIYTHHNTYYESERVKPVQNTFVRVFSLPFIAIYQVCYFVGYAIVRTTQPVAGLPKKIKGAKFKLHRRQWRPYNQSMNKRQTRLALTTFVLLVGVVSMSIHGAMLIASGQKLKGQVMGSADKGLDHLNQAQTALQNQDTTAVNQQLQLALTSFQTSQDDLNNTNSIIGSLLLLVPQKYDADNLLEASKLMTEGGISLNKFYQMSQEVSITPQGIAGKDAPDGSTESGGNVLGDMNVQLKDGTNKISRAITLLQTMDPSVLPKDKRATFLEARDKLETVKHGTAVIADVFDLLVQITSGTKNTLLLFQNNNELRPTGGFLGTYGAMKLRDGRIDSLHISSIYDLDGQLKQLILPPKPLEAVNKRWYLRDSNWWTNFPESAKAITSFYEKEGGETPDMIIAMTPSLITELLKITGPITLDRYRVTFTADNFAELAQAESSVNYDRTLNQPKQILADFVPALLQHLNQLKGPQLIPVITSLQRALLEKQILFYSNDPALQARLDSFNWAGTIKQTDRDYLMVSEANLGGTKTDTFLKKQTSLKTEIGPNGVITNTLTIHRVNPLPNKPEFKQRSFVRIYVPQGAKLTEARGFTPVSITPNDPNGIPSEQVTVWEKGSVTDTVSGTLIGLESGKTFFGNWLEVAGGEDKTVIVTYTLPFSLGEVDHHSLLLQKQPGSIEGNFDYSVSFPEYGMEWKNVQLQSLTAHNLTISQPLSKDYFFGFIFKRP